MHILIAEDNPVIQMLHCARMTSWGYNFDIASNGQEAVEYAQNNEGKYDLCLMDIEMPTMYGIEAAKIIRRTVKYFPILAYTSNAAYKAACYEAGMDGFIQKASPDDDLLTAIKNLAVKLYKFISKPNGLEIIEEMPVDKEHADELRALASKNLCKLMLFNNPNHALIVHKNLMNKISYDFNVKGQLLTTFINREQEKPTRCHLFKESNNLLPQTLLTEDDYVSMIKEEDNDLDNYQSLSLDSKPE